MNKRQKGELIRMIVVPLTIVVANKWFDAKDKKREERAKQN